ncbi:hypothetical protein [Rhodococcus aetherivorans]|uniref:hypothetical protein n=1 Tax=Rhodococcus aetherivorans TaxID=191292 RepID=UPI000497AA8C|nr:hypothetical protein [Rhodococcus aetherivorans]
MGYGYYALPDGREAGYGVEAECDATGCSAKIDRGLGCLCGENPAGHKDDDEPGCGNYYCPDHLVNHRCSAPQCGVYSTDESLCCSLVRGHDLPHRDNAGDEEFSIVAG